MTLQELLGIELPIIQAPMAGVQGSALAVAVSNAGGLGSLPCAMLDAGRHAQRARGDSSADDASRSTSTSSATRRRRPTPRAKPRWRAALAPYYAELGIDAAAIAAGAGARCRSTPRPPTCSSEFRPPVVSFHFGLPSRRAAGARAGLGREGAVVGDDRRRGALARGARRRCDHRAGARGRRPPRACSCRTTSTHAGRHVRAGAADRRRRCGCR